MGSAKIWWTHALCFLLILTYRMFAVYDFCFLFSLWEWGALPQLNWEAPTGFFCQEVSSVPWRCVGFWRKFYLSWAAAAGSLAKMGWVGWICSWVDWEVQNGTTLGGGSMWKLQVWYIYVYDTTCRNAAQYRLHVLRDFEILVVFGWAFVGLEHGCWFWCSTVSQIAACCCESSARYMPSEKNAASAK